MDQTFGVVIGTFGDDSWSDRAMTAYESALRQTTRPVDTVHVHGATLAEARNAGAEKTDCDWLVFLDADDTLDPGYIAAMTSHAGSDPALLQPSTLGVYPDGHKDADPVLIPQRPLSTGNFMVIGTAIRRDQFFQVGGFQEWPIYEDWDLWIRAWRDGATFVPVPEAIYRVGVNEDSRNKPDRGEQVHYFNEIRDRYFR